jgi:hypothetical protein
LVDPNKRRKYYRSLSKYYHPESVNVLDVIADDFLRISNGKV